MRHHYIPGVPDFISGILLAVLIAIIVFLVLRELVCWYWKINRRVGLLEDIHRSLQILIQNQRRLMAEAEESSPSPPPPDQNPSSHPPSTPDSTPPNMPPKVPGI